MVGGFSFYDRAEVKDILSYMKLVLNPHDSIALARVVNSPARGIGKTTMETLERIALTTGISTWDAIARATEQQLLSARALQALAKFRRLIEDARALLGPNFAERPSYQRDAEGRFDRSLDSVDLYDGAPPTSDGATDFNPEEFATEPVTDESAAAAPTLPSTPALTSASTSVPPRNSPPSPPKTPRTPLPPKPSEPNSIPSPP
jgi:DNA helicase-2/ATP-dependent DNA helicase PcrA